MEEYRPVCTNKIINVHNFIKLIENCPFTSTLNLAFTASNFIEHSDIIGWNDQQLMQAILTMLKTHPLDHHVKLKTSIRAHTSLILRDP